MSEQADWADEMAREHWPAIVDAIRSSVQDPRDAFAAALRKAVAERIPKDAMDAARQIGFCAAQAGVPILKLDDPDDWKRAVAEVKKRAVAQAVADERERCAQKAEIYGAEVPSAHWFSQRIAARIRAGSET